MIAIVVLAFVFGRPFVELSGTLTPTQTFWAIMGITVVGFVVTGLNIYLTPWRPKKKKEQLYDYGWGIAFVLVVILSPLIEEFVFRYLFMGATYGHNAIVSMLLSGLLFALVHEHFLVAKFYKGVAYAWLYVASGTVWAPIAAHAFWNCIVLFTARSAWERSLYESDDT